MINVACVAVALEEVGARKNGVACYASYDQRHVKYVKINQSRQLTLDGVVDSGMDHTSNDAGASPTYYLLFSTVFFLLLFTTLSYNTPIM